MTFDLPMPPSVNEMYIVRDVQGKKGRSLGYGYRRWRDDVLSKVRSAWEAAGQPAFTPPLSVTIAINLDHRGDIDNRVKACLDVMGKAIPEMPDDRWIDDLRIYRDRALTGARVTVEDAEHASSFQSFGDVAKGVVADVAEKMA